jgi:hypothetical protein
MAFLRCRALQRPARSVMFRFGSMRLLSGPVVAMTGPSQRRSAPPMRLARVRGCG